MDAYERLECWGNLGYHLRSGRSLDQSSREKQMLEEQGKNERSSTPRDDRARKQGNHQDHQFHYRQNGLPHHERPIIRLFQIKREIIRDTHETKPFCCY